MALISMALPDVSLCSIYTFLDIIGLGGMGVIYKARHNRSSQTVAIKMIHARLASEHAILRFQREGKLLSLLSEPGIVALRHLNVSESGHPYMVMDYVEGHSLRDLLAAEGPLAQRRFLNIFKQVCSSLVHAHAQGIVHRDIKPANIMVVPGEGSEKTKLLDFGIAKLLGDTDLRLHKITKPGDRLGSPLYISPEQARGLPVDERSDIYSLGCTMYEALAGIPPFVGATSFETMLLHLNEEPKPIAGIAPSPSALTNKIEALIIRALAKQPGDRPATMRLVAQELEALSARIDSPGLAEKRSTQASSWHRPVVLAVAGLLTIILVCAGLAMVPYKPASTPAQPPPIKSITVR